MILYYKPKRGDALLMERAYRFLTEGYNLDFIILDEKDLDTSISNLLEGRVGLGQDEENHSSDSFVIFDIEYEFLTEILDDMREEGLYLPYKVQTTDNNRKWTLRHLIDHVHEEAEVMRALNVLYKLSQAAEGFEHLDSYDEEKWQNFQVNLKVAKALINDVGKREISVDEVNKEIEALNKSVHALME